jgi:uncharacterized protein YdiU (UPF0061 family)
MAATQPDYALAYLDLETLLALSMDGAPMPPLGPKKLPSDSWLSAWLNAVGEAEGGPLAALQRMQENNPAVLPRNHLVEQALDEWVLSGRTELWDEIRLAFRRPYQRLERHRSLNQPPKEGDAGYTTFCGT